MVGDYGENEFPSSSLVDWLSDGLRSVHHSPPLLLSSNSCLLKNPNYCIIEGVELVGILKAPLQTPNFGNSKFLNTLCFVSFV